MTSNSEKKRSGVGLNVLGTQGQGRPILFTGTAVSNYSLIITLSFEFVAYRGQYFVQSHANHAQIIYNRPINYFHL